jgi:very-short-patch-repair endonuclease
MPADLLPKAKTLRQQMTDAEQCLWRHLRDRRFCKVKFRRQEPISPYIVDFVAMSEKLIVELDGGQHADEAAIDYDRKRTAYLEAQGYQVLRFWNDDCLARTTQVLEQIGHALRQW